MRTLGFFGLLGALIGALNGCAASMSAEVNSPCAADIDGDGYVGVADLCPNEKEDGLGPEPRDGCPLKPSVPVHAEAHVEAHVAPPKVSFPKLPVLSRPRLFAAAQVQVAPPPPVQAHVEAHVQPPEVHANVALPELPVLARGSLVGEVSGSANANANVGLNANANVNANAAVGLNASGRVAAGAGVVLPFLPILPRATLLAELDAKAKVEVVPPPLPTVAEVTPPPPPPPAPPPPPPKPKRVEVVGDEIKINEKILFDTGLASIDKKSDELIVAIAAIIKEHADIQFIEIAGHADARGSAQMNRDLTQRRAQAVVKRLESLGVEAIKLRAVGYGSYCPIDPATNDDAYEKNRRVEFKILRRGGVDAAVKWGGCDEAQKHGIAPVPIPASAPKGAAAADAKASVQAVPAKPAPAPTKQNPPAQKAAPPPPAPPAPPKKP